MAITVNTPSLNAPEQHQHGEPGYLREQYINIAGKSLCAELKNREAAQYCVDALREWKSIDGAPPSFKNYLLYRIAFKSQLDLNGGRLRGLLESAVKALFGEQPQPLVDEAVELLAFQLNSLNIDIDVSLVLGASEPQQL